MARRTVLVAPSYEEVQPDDRLTADQLDALARSTAVFLPGDPPRTGAVAFHSTPPPVGLDVRDVTIAARRGAAVRRRSVAAVVLPVERAVPVLARARGRRGADPATVFWGHAVLLALQLVARGRILPGVSDGGFDAWRVGPLDQADLERLRELAAAMPPEAHASPMSGAGGVRLPEPEPLLRNFLNAVADVLPRTPAAPSAVGGPSFATRGPQHIPHQRGWATEVATGLDVGLRVSLRVELPDGFDDADAFRAVVQLRSLADASLITDATDLWQGDGRFGPRARLDVLLTLRRASRAWEPLGRLLDAAVPASIELSDDETYDLLGDAAARLAAAGVDVHFPKELARELTATATVGESRRPGSALPSHFSPDALLRFEWQLALGGQPLTDAEMDRIAEAARPLVRLRDQWVLVGPELIRKARERDLKPLTAIDALGAALTGTTDVDGVAVPVTATGRLADLRQRISDLNDGGIGQPAALVATLRDYQLRGLRWLERMTSLGLGGCLADDMGLGKTITLIALHLHRQMAEATSGPTLVVCPASLLGNWQREIERFAPGTPVLRYHGTGRTLDDAGHGFVLTTYGTLRQDVDALAGYTWGLLVADEAQHVKNPHSHTARALRTIPSQARVALTGTPVENNLSELWALLDWTTPGLLGTLRTFRTRYATAVESGAVLDSGEGREAAERLARLVKPFLLRRRKSDPGIAPELPPKTETDHPVALSREQAALYEAVVRETMAAIEQNTGIARRGLVLKLLTALKQICNHPAQYLKESGTPAVNRSGKLELLDELLDTILAEDAGTLIFTQYVEMGRLLEHHLAARGVGTQFLHGRTPVKRREEMVERFQSGRAPVFLLSLKAAGVGLNLTRAGHVIHYDRWWNPAVEDQATDRAYRIGQTQPVQVHRLITEGTVEERIAEAMKAKRDLADTVLTAGEAALTELSDAELADLVSLRRTR